MDYLPTDPHEKEKIKQTMQENKMRDYRSYIVDKDIAKSLVKGIIIILILLINLFKFLYNFTIFTFFSYIKIKISRNKT